MIQRLLLWYGVAMPVVYFASIFGTALAWPGFDHATAAPSELGTGAAPMAGVFNAGLLLSGVLGMASAVGLQRAWRTLAATLLAIAVALPALSLVVAALFPLPSPHHLAFNIVLAGLLIPPLAAWTLWRDDGRWARILAAVTLIEAAALASGLGGGLMTAANAGWWIRALGLILFGSAALACWRSLTRA
jgi:hypothetical protein